MINTTNKLLRFQIIKENIGNQEQTSNSEDLNMETLVWVAADSLRCFDRVIYRRSSYPQTISHPYGGVFYYDFPMRFCSFDDWMSEIRQTSVTVSTVKLTII